ncbi:hypothetical protein, no similarity [Maudiozyma barnettii]|uniref:PA14 domain-containing protein n=1 Tax=Maudiozyma barnettii TaxID=61262 RepID=A0A8H2ZJG3_9SACH|nr:hypothetical protein, no similarity [Kazachstania barnettii]CAB4255963.1 hypothetical protein, no similarity [Kazachstania barnettii]CAD1784523.1 hypothetical protein, no similarity [Kazachstania barnettii]
MNNLLLTLITTFLFTIVRSQENTYPKCSVPQFEYDEDYLGLGSTGMSMITFANCDLDNKAPGKDQTKWEYLTGFTLYGGVNKYTSTINFEATTGGDPNTVVYGDVYGRNTTISNFTFGVSSTLVVPKTGYYTFNIAASEGALMALEVSMDTYCCENYPPPKRNLSFYVADLQSEPENNKLEDSVLLDAGFRYTLAVLYLNTNGADASLQITMTDPDGVKYNDIDQFLHMVTGAKQDYCSYINVTTTTIVEWEGSTTQTSLQYATSTNADGERVIESLYIVQTPAYASSSVSSSAMEISSTVATSSITSSEPESSTVVSSETESQAESSTNISSEPSFSSATTSEVESSSVATSEVESSSVATSEVESSTVITSVASSSMELSSSATLTSDFVSESSVATSDLPSSSSNEPLSSFSSTLDSLSEMSTSFEPDTSSDISTSVSDNGASTHISLSSDQISTSDSESHHLSSSSTSSPIMFSSETGISSNSFPSGGSTDYASTKGDDIIQSTEYITKTSVIATTVTTLCSTPTLVPGQSTSSLEYFTSTYTTEITTSVIITSCPNNVCHTTNNPSVEKSTQVIDDCSESCSTTSLNTRESLATNEITTVKVISSAYNAEDSIVTKPTVTLVSSQSTSGTATSHIVLENLNMGSNIKTNIFTFLTTFLISLIF